MTEDAKKFIMFIFLDTKDFKEHLGDAFQQAAIYKFQRTSDFQKGTKFKPCDFEFFSIWRGDFYPIRTKHLNTAILANRAGSTVK